MLCLAPTVAQGQKVIVATIPPNVNFAVTNISVATVGNPAPTTVSVTSVSGFIGSDKVRISVRADAPTFSGPGGSAGIAVSNVTWTATASRGNALGGTLSSTAYSEVFRSNGNFTTGSVSVTWRLAPLPAAGLRAGTHTLPVRWKFEVF